MSNIEKDLRDCLGLISADWKMQNNYSDFRTNFVYKCKSLDECLKNIEANKVSKEYALHRWYNFMTSVTCEYLFCEFGAIHETDPKNHDVDVFINKIPFDVKLTIYPAKLSTRPYDLATREGKNQMIKWYYENQSQQSRKQLINRLYVVCDGKTPYECLKMKSDFELLRKRISDFMALSLKNGLNKIDIYDNGRKYSVYSDIVYISYEE